MGRSGLHSAVTIRAAKALNHRCVTGSAKSEPPLRTALGLAFGFHSSADDAVRRIVENEVRRSISGLSAEVVVGSQPQPGTPPTLVRSVLICAGAPGKPQLTVTNGEAGALTERQRVGCGLSQVTRTPPSRPFAVVMIE